MAKTETNILKRVMVSVSTLCRVFRNNVGVFTTDSGDKIRTGLCTGSSDLIGWVPVEITPHMVGKKVAIFLGIEIKSGRGVVSKPQKNFIYQINKSGGIAFVARSPEKASLDLKTYIEDIQNARTRDRS